MATRITVDPVTRLEGHLKIEVLVDLVNGKQQVVDAWATGTLFRGFETLLVNRHPADAQHITQRICGVCPVSHGIASVLALDEAYKVSVPYNARIMRNLVLGANLIDSHILHFYHLTLPDYIEGNADMAPWQPSWDADKRIGVSGQVHTILWNNYVNALEIRRKAHEMGALFGGRLPHTPVIIPGGVTTQPTSTKISRFQTYLSEIISFIQGSYIPDVKRVAAYYPDYYEIGEGYRNLLAFGAFELNKRGTKFFKMGRVVNGDATIQPVDLELIKEYVTYSWYQDATNNLHPASGVTTPLDPVTKTQAYSWLKAPRYQGQAYEAGPLARMWVSGYSYGKPFGVSVMDRNLARAREALKVAVAMQTWVGQLRVGGSVYSPKPVPTAATSFGLTEAPRGALGHWLKISGGKLSQYQVITPTCWNASPRDSAEVRGPMEQALIGTPVTDINQPIEVLRVIHSFDPCLSCAVHVMRPGEGKKIFAVPHFHGGEEIHSHDHGDGRVHCHLGHDHAHGHDHDH